MIKTRNFNEIKITFNYIIYYIRIFNFIFKRNTPQLAADGIKGIRIQLGLDQVSLLPISCGSALDAPPLAAWVRCRRFA